jgi:hypothetical protein
VLENLTAVPVKHTVLVINESKHQLIGNSGDGHRFGCRTSYALQEVREDAGRSTSPGLGHALDSAYHLTRGKAVLFGMALPRSWSQLTCMRASWAAPTLTTT